MENLSPSERKESVDVTNSPYSGNYQTTLTVKSAACVACYCVELVHSPSLGGSKNLPSTSFFFLRVNASLVVTWTGVVEFYRVLFGRDL